jgi:hypothetical protein
MTSREARADVMKFWPIITTLVAITLGAAVPAVLWAGHADGRIAEIEKKADKISEIAVDVALIKQAVQYLRDEKRPK